MEKVLLILESEDMQSLLLNALSEHYEVHCCAPADARTILMQLRPEALVLDLYLPESSGFTLLARCSDLLPPVILLLSRLLSPFILEMAQALGVGFVIRTPCAMDYITARLGDMLQLRHLPVLADDRALAEELLLLFRFPVRARGFPMLSIAIRLSVQDSNRLLTKEVYPLIAREYGCSWQAVDQAIRRLLRRGWEQRERNAAIWDSYFPGYTKRPTNGDFITTVANALQKKYPSRYRKGP